MAAGASVRWSNLPFAAMNQYVGTEEAFKIPSTISFSFSSAEAALIQVHPSTNKIAAIFDLITKLELEKQADGGG